MADHHTISELWRYPLKSAAGERVPAATLGPQGVHGDRRFALQDRETGKIISAKQPAHWAGLPLARARYEGEPSRAALRLAWPGTTEQPGDASSLDAALSAWLGRAVTLLEQLPSEATIEIVASEIEENAGMSFELPLGLNEPGTFFDFAAIHLVTTSTLAALEDVLDHGSRRFRPNLVIDTGRTPGFVENDWVGRTLQLGEAELCILAPSPRCVIPTLSHADAPGRNLPLLRALAQRNKRPVLDWGVSACAGVYAKVTRPGLLREGDRATLA